MTRKSAQAETLTGIAQSVSFGATLAAPVDLQPLRTLTEFARSIFDAARDLLEDGGELVKP